MYFSYWFILVSVSLGVSLIAFIWGLGSGQFSDQGRARYLPLSDECSFQSTTCQSGAGMEKYALLFVMALGLAGIAASIFLSLYRLHG